jgi:transcriptional regulator with XRE-family HTH domain
MAQHASKSLRKEIGARIRGLRERAGISSQESLAENAGVHRTNIGYIERGETGVTVESLAAILSALGVSLSEFFQPFNSRYRGSTPRKRN